MSYLSSIEDKALRDLFALIYAHRGYSPKDAYIMADKAMKARETEKDSLTPEEKT